MDFCFAYRCSCFTSIMGEEEDLSVKGEWWAKSSGGVQWFSIVFPSFHIPFCSDIPTLPSWNQLAMWRLRVLRGDQKTQTPVSSHTHKFTFSKWMLARPKQTEISLSLWNGKGINVDSLPATFTYSFHVVLWQIKENKAKGGLEMKGPHEADCTLSLNMQDQVLFSQM